MIKKGSVLSLDIATTTGWAFSNDNYGNFNVKPKKDESMGMRLIRFKEKFVTLIKSQNVEIVIYERPAGRHAASIIFQSKLIGLVEEYCEKEGISVRGYSAKEIKSFATGKGNASKPEMIKKAKEMYNYSGSDDNEADALHMLNLFYDEHKSIIEKDS